jgi:hypothetical protein
MVKCGIFFEVRNEFLNIIFSEVNSSYAFLKSGRVSQAGLDIRTEDWLTDRQL